MLKPLKRLLVLRGGAIGDFVLTVPVLHALRLCWPEAELGLVTYPRTARLALACGLADFTESLDTAESAALFSENGLQPGRLLESIRSSDAVISYFLDPTGVVHRNLSVSGAKRLICASPLPVSGHAVDHLLAPLAVLGVPFALGAVPRLTVSAELIEKVKIRLGEPCFAILASQGRQGQKLVAIHPGSGSPTKNWPLEKFLQVAGRLATQFRVIFIAGEAEEPILAELVKQGMPVMHGLDLPELAAMLSCCSGYLGNDSGITHLAAAVGISTVALFGPSDPLVWGSRGQNVRIVPAPERTTESMARIKAEDVLEEMRETISRCKFCRLVQGAAQR